MCHERFTIIESSRFVQARHYRHAEQPVGIHGTDTHHSVILQVVLIDIAAEPYGKTVLELGDSRSFQGLDGKVHVVDPAIFGYVTKEPYRIGATVGFVGGRSVDNRDVVVKVHAYVFVEELLWAEGPRNDQLVVFVADTGFKRLRRLAKANRKHAVELPKKLSLLCGKSLLVGAFRNHVAERFSAGTKESGKEGIHISRVRRAVRFGHGVLRHDTVLLHDGSEHVPLPAVAKRVKEKKRNISRGRRLICGGNDVLEEPVGALVLVPEEGIGLR